MTAHTDPVHAVTVLVVGGTGESYDGDMRTEVTGLLSGVTDALDDRFDTRWVGYPASYGPAPHLSGISYADSVAAGQRALAAALHAVVGPVMIIGYSQGAVVIRRLLADLDARADMRALSRVVAVGFVADPISRPASLRDATGGEWPGRVRRSPSPSRSGGSAPPRT